MIDIVVFRIFFADSFEAEHLSFKIRTVLLLLLQILLLQILLLLLLLPL